MFVSSVRILSILTSFIYINGLITSSKSLILVLGNMGLYNNGKRDSWTYSNKSLKNKIDNNEFVKSIRSKLMKEKLKKHFKE